MKIHLLFLLIIMACNSDSPDLRRVSDVTPAFLVQLGNATKFFPGADHGRMDACNEMKVYKDGSIFCVGTTNGSMGEVNGSGVGFSVKDVVLAKFKPNGELDWIRQLGSTSNDEQGTGSTLDDGRNDGEDTCSDLDFDSSGNIYCVGFTDGYLDGTANQKGPRDAIIVKFSPEGELLSVWVDGTNKFDYYSSVAIDRQGNIICAGYTRGEYITGERPDPDARPDRDILIVKYSPSGAVLSRVQLGEKSFNDRNSLRLSNLITINGSEEVTRVRIDHDDNIVVAALTDSSLVTVNTDSSSDMVFWKLDPSLNTIWLRQYHYQGNDKINDIVVDDYGDYLATGNTNDSIGEENAASTDVIVMKLDGELGNIVKVSQLGARTHVPGGDTSKVDLGQRIALDREGSIYVGGSTEGSLGEANSSAYSDIFVAKWDRNMNFITAIQLGSVTNVPGGDTGFGESVSGLHIDYFGYLTLGGTTFSSLGEIKETPLPGPPAPPPNGYPDFYVLRMDNSDLKLRPPRF